MKLIVHKPTDGKVVFELDDRRGITGYSSRRIEVAEADFEAALSGEIVKWHAKRKSIYDARRLARQRA